MFDFDAGKERLSILSKYVRLPRSAEHGEVTASLLYERLVMAAIAASKTEEDLGRIFSFSWDTVRYLTNMNLSNDDFAKLTLAIFDRRPIPCLFIQQKTGDWFEMPMICAIECGEDAGVLHQNLRPRRSQTRCKRRVTLWRVRIPPTPYAAHRGTGGWRNGHFV